MKKDSQTFYEHIHKEYWKQNNNDEEFGSIFSDRIEKSKQLISAEKPKKVLNIGFESIKVASYIVSGSDFEECILADIDENLCNISEEFTTRGFKSLNIDVSSDMIPFKNDYFDFVYAGEVIEHLWNPDFAIREMHRVTKTGGTILLTTPNLASWYNRLLLLIGLMPINVEVSSEIILGRRFKFLGNGSPPVGHIRVYTKEALKELVEREGMKDFMLYGYKREDIHLDGLFSRFPSLASGLIFKITKSP